MSSIRRARSVAVFLLIAVVALAVAGRGGWLWWQAKTLAGPFEPLSGNGYWTATGDLVPEQWRPLFTVRADSNSRPTVSTLRLLEDGKPLTQPHSVAAEIMGVGGGRYLHWGNTLLFSASDNSDPRANGRSYTIYYSIALTGRAFAGILLVVAGALVALYFRAATNWLRKQRTRPNSAPTSEDLVPAARTSSASTHWLKPVLFSVIALILVVIFCIGFVVSTDMVWRSLYSTQRTGRGIDISVFRYQDYVVSTHPVVTLGHKKEFLDDYFGDRSCAEPDGTIARFNSLGFRSPEFVVAARQGAE